MKTHTLHYSCTLEASSSEVCHFHMDTHNLMKITPPWITVSIQHIDQPIIKGSCVILDIKRFGIKTKWKMQIEQLDCPHNVTDKMMSGPFNFFRHERKFTSLAETKTLMEETITLALPFGCLGNLAFPLIRRDMDAMFAYRHQATQNYFHKRSLDVSP